MLFGKVVGTVVSTKKTPSLEGLKLLLVRNVDHLGELSKGYVVAADSVGAGVGEVVLYATGSSARQTDITNNKPVDAVIMGIVDTWDVDDKTVFTKYQTAGV
ncbi:MAG: EutN/CcmL family microcompartment protein [Nitrospinae bacterium]|nr:EutN/CcmL family microcompartment protein [Nitrospinota bacterium]